MLKTKLITKTQYGSQKYCYNTLRIQFIRIISYKLRKFSIKMEITDSNVTRFLKWAFMNYVDKILRIFETPSPLVEISLFSIVDI